MATVNEFLSTRYSQPIDLVADEAEIRRLLVEFKKIQKRLDGLIDKEIRQYLRRR